MDRLAEAFNFHLPTAEGFRWFVLVRAMFGVSDVSC